MYSTYIDIITYILNIHPPPPRWATGKRAKRAVRCDAMRGDARQCKVRWGTYIKYVRSMYNTYSVQLCMGCIAIIMDSSDAARDEMKVEGGGGGLVEAKSFFYSVFGWLCTIDTGSVLGCMYLCRTFSGFIVKRKEIGQFLINVLPCMYVGSYNALLLHMICTRIYNMRKLQQNHFCFFFFFTSLTRALILHKLTNLYLLLYLPGARQPCWRKGFYFLVKRQTPTYYSVYTPYTQTNPTRPKNNHKGALSVMIHKIEKEKAD